MFATKINILTTVGGLKIVETVYKRGDSRVATFSSISGCSHIYKPLVRIPF